MKLSLQKFYCLLILLSLPFFAQSAHIIGGEMTYECVGNGNYIITLKVYRDCQGGGAGFDGPNNGRISIYLGDSQVEFDRIVMPDAVITEVDPDIGNPCLQVPPGVCVEQGVYTIDLGDQGINLPSSDETYYIIYQRCCRNNSISNIINPGETGATYTIEISPEAQPDANGVCVNDSPIYNTFPPVVICVNEELVFDHSAVDPDADLLVYELCSPLKGGGTAGWQSPGNADDFDGTNPNPDKYAPHDNVDFIASTYSPTQPITGDPAITINPITGLLSGVPDTEGQYVVGICVKEYRNGVLLSTVQRDFQFNVTFCEPNVVAVISGDDLIGDSATFYTYTSCVDSTITFLNQSYQSEFIDSYLWEFEVGGIAPLSSSVPNATITFPGPGHYEGIMVVNPGTVCNDTAYVQLDIYPPSFADFAFEYDTCIAGPVVFQDLSSTEADNIVAWDWEFGDGQISSEQNPTVQYTDPGNFPVTLTITDNNGCTNSVTQNVNWFPVPPLIVIEPSQADGCPPLNVFFNNLSTPIDDSYEITWDFGDGGTGNAISPNHLYTEPFLYTVKVGITSPIGCYTERIFEDWILIDSFPEADFSWNPDRITNFEPEVNFVDQSIRAVAWEWDFANGAGIAYMQNPSFSMPDTGLQTVQLIVQSKEGCLDTIQKVIDVIPEIRFFMPNAFTPNEDSVNEIFMPGGYFRGLKDYKMTIWNRYGELVFESDDPYAGWNGKKNNVGRNAPNGIYVCLVSFTGPRGAPHEVKGFATVIR